MPPNDHAQRRQAIDPRRSYIVQAPAGSGKTELLTRRFLRLLGVVERPESVLAITFTRKATQEMRQRILRSLEAASGGQEPPAEHELEAWRLAQAALVRDRRLGWGLTENPGKLQIYTIDGLCSRIAGRFPRVGEGLAGLTVVEQAEPLYREAARRLIEALAEGKAGGAESRAFQRVLMRLDGNIPDLQNLLADMLGRRDQWLERLGEPAPGMQGALAERQALELGSLRDVLGGELLDAALKDIHALARAAADADASADLLRALDNLTQAPESLEVQVEAAHRALCALASNTGAPYKPGSVGRYVLPGESPDRPQRIERLAEAVGTWHASSDALDGFALFVKSPPLNSDPEGELLEHYRLLLTHAEAHLRVLFVERGQTDFQHMAHMALAALGDDATPGDALLVEDSAIAHILMDEFQDTSHLQYRLLERLTEGWTQGDGRTLFLVGDPMQSIYRFRKADVANFNRVFRQCRLGQVALAPLRLTSNFRSRAEVIAFVNEHFPGIFRRPWLASMGAVPYVPVTPQRESGGRVNINAFDPQEGFEVEAASVAEDIRQRLEADRERKIGVLARRRVDLVTVAAALRRAGVPFEAVELEGLADRPVVQDLMAITRALLHPGDRIAWLALLRAPGCGLDVRSLHALAGDDPGSDLFERMGNPGAVAGIPRDRRARIARLCAAISAALAARPRVALHRLVEVVWVRVHGPAACTGPSELDNARAFLELLARAEQDEPHRLLDTLQTRMAELYARSGAATVQLMTIHKAKGLQFDSVFLPGLDRRAGGGRRNLLRVQDVPMEDGREGVLMAPLKMRQEGGAVLYDYLARLDRDQDTSESQRLLYVAATRAREELHLSGCWTTRTESGRKYAAIAGDSFMDLLSGAFGPKLPDSVEENLQDPGDQPPPELPLLRLEGEPGIAWDLDAPVSDHEPLEPLRVGDRDRLALGEALHRWLEVIHDHWQDIDHDTPLADWLDERRAALESTLLDAGAGRDRLPGLADELQRLLVATLESEPGRAVVSPEGKQESRAEAVYYRRNGSEVHKHVIDRLYRTEDGFVIVDYKTGGDADSSGDDWQAQLARYAECVAAAGQGEVETAFILRAGDNRLVPYDRENPGQRNRSRT